MNAACPSDDSFNCLPSSPLTTFLSSPAGAGFDVSRLRGLSADSRTVKDGFLFAAFSGAKTDGAAYIAQAIKNGASVILTHSAAAIAGDIPSDVLVINHDNPRQLFAHIAAQFYAHNQPEHIAAITGTNGKTSTAHFVRELWSAMDKNAASIGTLGVLYGADTAPKSASMTSPPADVFHRILSEVKTADVSHLVIEASSHGLHQCRIDGARIEVGAFTNLSHDHLDYHDTMAAYLQAKLRLFTDILTPDGMAVLNGDIPQINAIKAACLPTQNIVTYGAGIDGACDIQLLTRTPTPHGQDVRVRVYGRDYDVNVPLIGDFQVMNILCAIGIITARNQSLAPQVMTHIEGLTPVAGRLERIEGHPNGAGVYVDYAHTPAALRAALNTVRPHTKNRLVCLFGCGGDRDKTKRAVMGGIAADLADMVYVSDDNPRGEPATAIRDAIMTGAQEALRSTPKSAAGHTITLLEVDDRARAITAAVDGLGRGDCLVIAGKGHEQGQIIGDCVTPFDDRAQARAAIAALNNKQNNSQENVSAQTDVTRELDSAEQVNTRTGAKASTSADIDTEKGKDKDGGVHHV